MVYVLEEAPRRDDALTQESSWKNYQCSYLVRVHIPHRLHHRIIIQAILPTSLLQLVNGYETRLVLVKVREGNEQRLLSLDLVEVHRGGQELAIVDGSIAVKVSLAGGRGEMMV